MPWKALNRRHIIITQVAKGVDKKRRCLAEEQMRESAERTFQAYVRPLTMVTSFKFLGRFVTSMDDDRLAVVWEPSEGMEDLGIDG